jgi:hypothetical protein
MLKDNIMKLHLIEVEVLMTRRRRIRKREAEEAKDDNGEERKERSGKE